MVIILDLEKLSRYRYKQFKKLNKIINFRQKLAKTLIDGISNLTGLQTPIVKKGNTMKLCNSICFRFKKAKI